MQWGRGMLKSLLVPAALAAALAVVPVAGSAQFVDSSRGGAATVSTATTVAQAARARDNTPAVLTGNIIAHQRRDYYTFRDGTGTITVEIPRVVFRGRLVNAETPLRLTGIVDRGVRGAYVEVFRLELLD